MVSLAKFNCERRFIVIFVIVKHNWKICYGFLIVYRLVFQNLGYRVLFYDGYKLCYTCFVKSNIHIKILCYYLLFSHPQNGKKETNLDATPIQPERCVCFWVCFGVWRVYYFTYKHSKKNFLKLSIVLPKNS